jgi:hypothetical protein
MSRWLPLIVGAVVLALAGVALFAAWWVQDGPNYSQIEPGLYVGGHVEAPPPGTHFVLNLDEQDDPYRAEHHLHEPIADAAPAPSLDWLERMVDLVEEHRRAGRTVFVHCRAGASRSGMVALAYLMREHGWSLEEALAEARSRRDIIRPNPAFMGLLRRWEKRLAEKGEGD